MRRLITIFLLLNLIASLQAQKSIDITYIADAGFLISSDTNKLLIDGIFNDGYGFYYTPTTQTLTNERNATYPFNDINVILNTHAHNDHINPTYLIEHMLNDSIATLLAPSPSVTMLKTVSGYDAIKSRIREITQTNQSKLDTTIDGINIKSMAIRHNDSTFLPTLNLGYVFEINGIKVFHPGDADTADLSIYQNLDLANDTIDIALIPYWFFFSNTGINIINYLNPKAIIITHVMLPNRPYNYAYVKNRIKSLTGIPPIYFMETPMETQSFIKENDSVFTFTETDSMYLGQTPPGITPISFNIPYKGGYIPTECIAVSPDGKEIYYAEGIPGDIKFRIKYFTYANSAWSDTTLLFEGYNGPVLSPSGDTLFFNKYYSTSDWQQCNTFFSVRNDTGWSTPSRFVQGINFSWLQKTNAGNYYVNKVDISKMVISTSDTTFNSLGLGGGEFFISRDESFIIFTSSVGASFGYNDLFVSFRNSDATWTSPKNLGSPINTNGYEVAPYVTADNNYLFFRRINASGQVRYWVKFDELLDSLKIESGITNVKNISFKQNIIIYPNPTNGLINISFGTASYNNAIVKIVDIYGKSIISETFHNLPVVTINLSGMPKGVYVVKLSTVDGRNSLTKKIIVE